MSMLQQIRRVLFQGAATRGEVAVILEIPFTKFNSHFSQLIRMGHVRKGERKVPNTITLRGPRQVLVYALTMQGVYQFKKKEKTNHV